MAIKLIKACKELNVGMSTAVTFFAKQGKEINPDPNTRIDDELYLMLAKEFNKDMALKLEAERQAAERQAREMQTVSIEQPAPSHIETEIPKPKVVGQIELDEAKKAREEAERQAAEAARIAAEAEAAAKAAAEAAAKAAAERIAREEAERKAKEAAKAKEKEAKAAKAKTEEAARPASQKPAANVEKPVVKEHAAAGETPASPASKPEIFTLGKPVLKDGPKVVGSIDLSAINQATRPAKKSKEEKKKEREERQQQQQQATEKRKRERIKNNKVDINDVRNQKTKPSKKKSVKVEVDDEEVQRQIKDTLTRLQGQKGKSNTSKYKRERREQEREKMASERAAEQAQSKVLKLTEFVTANDLAVMMNLPVTKIIATCMTLGLFVSINQRLDAETINIVAEEFGFTTEYVSAHVVDEINADEQINEEDIEPRCPIVTVMGHVDHGKTSLLDHIRNTNVIAGEAGGITQHIGAYSVTMKNGRKVTFLDTPGHEAFTAMRARGAQVTDIAIIIVAADDSVMPTTKEAIAHCQAAGVPMVFAINKIDKPGANPDRIREDLANMNLLVEEWGGKYQCQEISAKKGIGVDDLMEKVLLEADMLDLKANPNRKASGTIIESSLDKGRGYVSTVLVSNGTLKVGDIVLAGTSWGRVKAMFNERNQRIDNVGPAEPAIVLGLNGAPTAGDAFHVIDTDQEAREIANKREQ
ncbi:MAG: translation initiation factor IF-2, partial [Paludibacteraceae bacterium]|nr:translation initiation factor IF-2 [Paludibacteraceae bacterium]